MLEPRSDRLSRTIYREGSSVTNLDEMFCDVDDSVRNLFPHGINHSAIETKEL